MRRASNLFLLCTVTTALAACGASSDTATTDGAASPASTSMAGAIVEAAKREAAGVRTNPLATPLPGNVEPTFTYGLVADMTSPLNATVSMRQVALQAQGIDARSAYEAIAAQYEAAGFRTHGMTEEKGSFTGGFSIGGAGNGLVAVDGGGTYVMLIVSPAKAGGEAEQEGISANVRFTIYTPTAPGQSTQ
jgi:hypothetical protein